MKKNKFYFVCIRSNSKISLHISYKKQKLHFHHTLKIQKTNGQWVSQQVYDYPLGFNQNFKNTKKINHFI